MKPSPAISYLNILFFGLALFVNYLSVVYELGGNTIRELSDKYDNLFTPAPQTFAIWSLIYLLLTVFLVLQFVTRYRDSFLTRSPLFLLSCIFNFSWILAWQYEYLWLSLLIMLALLTSLTLINRQLQNENHLIFRLTFGIYLGWICIATIANATAVLVGSGINPAIGLQENITVGMLAIGAALVALIMRQLKNPFLAIAVCWAFYGIYTKRANDHPVIAWAALAALFAVTIWAIFLCYTMEGKRAGKRQSP